MVFFEAVHQMKCALIYGNPANEKSGDEKKQRQAHQKYIIIVMILTVTFIPVYLWLGYNYIPLKQPELPTIAHRLAYTIKWQIPSIAFFFFAIFGTSLRRFISKAYNPIEGGDKDVVVYKNILTNSVEAYLINGGAQMILTTFLEESQMKIIPLLVVLFVLSRVLFWRGYTDASQGRSNRAYGFGLSTATALGIILYCTYRFIMEMITM